MEARSGMGRRALSVLVVAAMLSTGLFTFGPSSEESYVVADPRVHASSMTYSGTYFSDDGNPDAYVSSTLAQGRKFVKTFPSVTVPANYDLVVVIATPNVAAGGYINGLLKVGPADSEYNLTSTLIQHSYMGKTTGAFFWLQERFQNVSALGFSSGRIGVEISCPSATTTAYACEDATAEAAGYHAWYYDGASWVNKTSAWIYFIRLYFAEPDDLGNSHSRAQLQLSSEIVANSGSYHSSDNWYKWNVEQVNDGISTVSSNCFGWFTDNTTTGAYLNLSFKNQIVFSIGDSIIAGHPYHDPNPNIYGTGDVRTHSMQYRLGTLLEQNIINRGIGSQTTTQILARLTTDVLSYNPDIVIVQGGLNDIVGAVPTATIEANLLAMYDAITASGAIAVAYTILPDGALSAPNKAKVITINDWIETQVNDTVKIVDVYTLMDDPGDPGDLLPAYDSGDHVHPSFAGYWAMGNYTFTQSPFSSTASVSTTYLIDSLIIEDAPTGVTAPGIVNTINVTYAGGYTILSFGNQSSSPRNMSRISTSWLNLTFVTAQKYNANFPTYLTLGELRIYGLPGTWAATAVYDMKGYQNITSSTATYQRLPYPRINNSIMTISSAGFVNVTSVYCAEDSTTWIANGNATTTFTATGLTAEKGYRAYVDGELLAIGEGPTFILTYSGGWSSHEFLLEEWYGSQITSLIGLSVTLVLLGIVVSVVVADVRMLNNPRMSPQAKMQQIIRSVIFIVIGLVMWGLLYSVAYG